MFSKSDSQRRAFLTTSLAYSLPVGGVGFFLLPTGMLLQDIYPKYYGLDFTAIGTAYFIAAVLTAIVNPVVGLLSDRIRARGVTHRAGALVGFTLLVLASYKLLVPPQDVTTKYFTFWLICKALSWALFEVPHLAWGAELARGYDTRTRLFGVRNGVVSLGGLCFYALPLLPIFGVHEFTPETLRFAAMVGLVYLIPALYGAIRFVPECERMHPASDARITIFNIKEDIKAILSNKPFLILVFGSTCFGIAQGMWLSLSAVILDYYYGLARYLPAIYVSGTVLVALTAPFMIRASVWLGKRRAFIFLNCGFLVFITAGVFVQPGKFAAIPLSIVCIGVFTVNIFNAILHQAFLADVADYGRWKFGKAQEASYYAAFYFFKIVLGSSAAPVGLTIINHMGFAPHGIDNMAEAKIAVALVFFLIPALMTIIGLTFVWRIPICSRRAAAIRSRIERRTQPQSHKVAQR